MGKFLFSVFLLLTVTVSGEQIFPNDLHAMPVLIEIPLADKVHSSYGTGIYLSYHSNTVFLVTAAHCIFDVSSTNRSALINSNAIISSFISKGDRDKKMCTPLT